MNIFSKEIINFFENQNFVIVSTISDAGFPHNSCKGIVRIDSDGTIYLMDLYRSITFKNLNNNPNMSITAVDEHKFKGYCLLGKARVLDANELDESILKAWEDKITSRVSSRVLKNIRGEKGHSSHPEVQLPVPQYMISMKADEVIDLTPHKLR